MILDFLFGKSSGGQRILTSQQLAAALELGSNSAAGVNVSPARALQLAAVWACWRVLSESVGQLPLQLYERTGERDKRKATDHPLYQVLHVAPNEQTTAQEYWETCTGDLARSGNHYAQIISVRGVVRELWPWRPEHVTPKRHRDTAEIVYDVRLADGKIETLPAWEVFHVKLPSLDGGLTGASPIAHARESIGSAIAAEQHGAGVFARGASPGGVLESPQPLSEQAQEKILESWKRGHEGSANAHRVGLLHSGMKFTSTAMPSTDLQWLEARKFSRSEIAGIFRVPPHMIGDLERATFSNIEHQALDFVVGALMPYLTRIEQRISLQLVQPKDRASIYAKFSVGGLLRGDMKARAEFYTRMVQNGALSPNEIRELEDMNPRDGGDIWLVPSNMTTAPIDASNQK